MSRSSAYPAAGHRNRGVLFPRRPYRVLPNPRLRRFRPRITAMADPEVVAAMERFMAANGTEIARADTKAAVLLGFMGATLGAFLTVTRISDTEVGHPPWWTTALWWSAVVTALLAIASFMCAIVPRRRGGRRYASVGPGYFEHLAPGMDAESLGRAFERIAQDPTGPLLASLRKTSDIIRVKYRWIEIGTTLLLATLPQCVAVLPV